jgi:hypothetical protein
MKLLWIVAGAVLATGTAASASDEDSGAPPEEKLVCRTEKVTGSRTKVKRTCMTKAQWDELAERTKKDMDDFSRNAGQVPPPKNPYGPG